MKKDIELTSVNEVFQYIIDNIKEKGVFKYGKNNVSDGTYFYICNFIEELFHEGFITEDLSNLALDYFLNNKPSKDFHIEFYNSPHFNKKGIPESTSWWVYTEGEKNNIQDVLDEKISFLRYLNKEVTI